MVQAGEETVLDLENDRSCKMFVALIAVALPIRHTRELFL